MSIRKKLTILLLAIAIIPMFLVGVSLFSTARRALHHQQLEKLEAIANLKVDKIESFFHERMDDIKITQGYYNIKTNLPILLKFPDKTNPEHIAAKEMLDKQLKIFREIHEYENVMLTGPQGKIIYVTNDAHAARDIGNTLPDPPSRAFEEGKKGVYLSDVYGNPERGANFEMTLTAPAHDFEGKFIGVIAFQINMAPIYKLMQDTTGLGRTGETLLGKKIGNNVVFLNPLRHDPRAAFKKNVPLGSSAAIPIQEAAQGREGSGLSIDYRDQEVIAVWRYVPSQNFGLVAKIDTHEAFAPITSLKYVLLIVMSIIATLSAFTAFLSAKSISGPIITLTKASRLLANGDLSQRVNIPLKDEIGNLAASFNKMAEDLNRSRDELTSDKEYTENIIKSMIDTLIVVDPEAKIKTINKATSDLLDYSEEALMGKPVTTIFEKENTPFEGTRMEKLIKQGSIKHYEMTYRTKSGEKIPMDFSGAVMRDKKGDLIGIVGIAHDMREIRHLMQKERKLATAAAAAAVEKQKTKELDEAYAHLREKTQRLEKFQAVTVDRELAMIMLKEEINRFREASGQPKKYQTPKRQNP